MGFSFIINVLFSLFQLGAESGVDNPNLRAMKTVFRIMPFVILPLTINFPTVSLSFTHSPFFFTVHIITKSHFLIVKVFFSRLQAVFTYWLTSNCFSLGQVALLRHPLVRDKLRIPEKIKHPESALPQTEGFFSTMKKGECYRHADNWCFGFWQ